mgnify:CR=1 FL=1
MVSNGPSPRDPASRLTPDELEAVLAQRLVRLRDLFGHQARIGIARELDIAETTVKAHVTAIMRKLGVQSRTQAVLIARQASFSSLMPEG